MLRKDPERLDVLVRRFLRGTGLENGLLAVQVSEAFDEVSGISSSVLKKTFKDGVLVCHMNSSLAREIAVLSKDEILKKVTLRLGENIVKEINFR